ncbi:hypothetical protein WN944_026810 [Citrus x changshan-huyou]|uniref:ABC transporter domain-containing protein n=1 Tax=Citrus x changshan-huyou TaxID=2935761 RepID=A0AAP0LGR3_9ROSI
MESSNKTANSLINVNEDDGVFLTWKDLTVTIVSNGKKGGSSILEDLTGYAKPGHLLAIMGPSGSGKTTLLDALAVKEAVYYSAQLQLPDTMPKSDKKERAEVTIREMGLQDAMNTRIRRLSGGQKRRVSISIEILTRPKLLFLDEPTSGLDSAASYYVMSRIAKLGQRDGIGRTIIASIHQPSSEFFAFNGFPCPTHQNPSDHFLKTINKDFQKDAEEGLADGEIPTEEVINILKRSYKSCGIYEQVGSQVAEICKQNYGTLEKKRKHASFLNQCHVLTRRSFVNMYRDLGYYWFRLAIYISMALGLATLFSNLGTGYRSIQARGSLLMFVASFITFMTIGGFPSFVEDMKVTPLAFQERNLLMVSSGSGIQGMMILGGGFFQLPNDIPKIFWKYPLYYIVFHKYAYQGMFKNEFEGLKFDNNQDGEQILRDTWQLELGYSKWVDLAILFGMVVVYRLVFLGIIKATEKLKPVVKAFMDVPPKPTTQIIENLEAVAYLPEVKV